MTDAEKEREYNEKINSLPALEGFGQPQKGWIRDNVDGKKYKTLAEVQRAALANPDCTGFTSLPKGGWKLRMGEKVNIGAGDEWYVKKDVSYLKNEFHPSRRDEL